MVVAAMLFTMTSWLVSGRPPLAARVLVVADELLLPGVHADHRLTGTHVPSGLLVDVAELGVTVRVLPALDGLGAGLRAEALLTQQAGDRVRAHPVPLAGERGREAPGRLHRPAQRRHRVAPLVRFHQCRQRGPKIGSRSADLFRPPPGLRTRPRGSSPASSPSTPLRTVVSLTWAARATARIPPWPRTRASAPIISRRCRSSGAAVPKVAVPSSIPA
jgi:hypothetical protein